LTALQQRYRDCENKEGTSITTSRRDFLKLSAGVAAGVLLGEPTGFAAPRPPHIVIIGAGISGLTAALTLRDAGFRATIYEGSNRIGGRMHSDTKTWKNDQVSEHCGELIDGEHKAILSLARRFKIAAANVTRAEPPQSTDTFHFGGQYYPPNKANEDFKAVYAAVKKDLTDVGYPTLYNSFTPAASKLDNLSAYDWIETRIPGGHHSRTAGRHCSQSRVRFRNANSKRAELDLHHRNDAASSKVRTPRPAVPPDRRKRAIAARDRGRFARRHHQEWNFANVHRNE
jgi:monoamine oxidase